jgi:S-adenosylmethionine hydrolase
MRPVLLLTDFGTTDPFVGLMKCVLETRCPRVSIIDLTHGVRPRSVIEGVFWLSRSTAWFPPNAVCIAVVDPGVGSERAALVVESEGRVYVGPDNGLLAGIADCEGAQAFVVDRAAISLAEPSATFHGRDVFAPIAAEIAAGRLAPSAVGPSARAIVPNPIPPVSVEPGACAGEIVVVDRFGNLLSNVEGAIARSLAARGVEIGGFEVPFRRTYADVPPGELVALENSFGVVEVARRDGSAAESLRVDSGSPLRVVS